MSDYNNFNPKKYRKTSRSNAQKKVSEEKIQMKKKRIDYEEECKARGVKPNPLLHGGPSSSGTGIKAGGGAVAGAIAGGAIFGPIGIFIGGAIGAIGAAVILK